MAQTAVDWLVNKIYMVIPNEERNFLEGLREQAKQMEKEQIMDADLNGSTRTVLGCDFTLSTRRVKELAEQYYNETYNK